LGQALVAQQKLARRRGHHVADAVVWVLFQHILRGLGKVDQQARAHRLHLSRQCPNRLGERLVDALLGIRQRNAVGQQATTSPQCQLGQQQPEQQLAAQRKQGGSRHGQKAWGVQIGKVSSM
jgi:hypothetical protein